MAALCDCDSFREWKPPELPADLPVAEVIDIRGHR